LPAALLVGNWVNASPAAIGITHFSIVDNGGGNFVIHAYGACDPTDCDWGVTPLYETAGSAVATYTGYRSLYITVVGSQLHVVSTSLASPPGGTTDDYFNRA